MSETAKLARELFVALMAMPHTDLNVRVAGWWEPSSDKQYEPSPEDIALFAYRAAEDFEMVVTRVEGSK